MISKAILRNAWLELLSRQKWIWFATLTFRYKTSKSRAVRLFQEWIRALRITQGAIDFGWVRTTEAGIDGDNLHFHVLICGLRFDEQLLAMQRWYDSAGEADIRIYREDGGAIQYILKTIRPNSDLDIDFELKPTPSPSTPKPVLKNSRRTYTMKTIKARIEPDRIVVGIPRSTAQRLTPSGNLILLADFPNWTKTTAILGGRPIVIKVRVAYSNVITHGGSTKTGQ